MRDLGMQRDGSSSAPAMVRQAQEVVGFYGDPDTTWGISVELQLDYPVAVEAMLERLDRLTHRYRHLGAAPVIERPKGVTWSFARAASASAPLGNGGRLVRILLADDARTVLITAHHGAVDGLGLLAVAEAAVGTTLHSSARGIGAKPARAAFLVSSLWRVWEALVDPPARFAGTGTENDGERLDVVVVPRRRMSSALVCCAAARAHRSWPKGANGGGRRFLVTMGVSRRSPGALAPDRRTAYVRIPLDGSASVEDVRRRIADAEPEPDFPETSAGGVGPAMTRLLRNRLGATAVVSNVGLVTGEGVRSIAMFPALHGPQAVGIGTVSTDRTTTVSVRTRRSDFTEEEAGRLLDLVLVELESAQ